MVSNSPVDLFTLFIFPGRTSKTIHFILKNIAMHYFSEIEIGITPYLIYVDMIISKE